MGGLEPPVELEFAHLVDGVAVAELGLVAVEVQVGHAGVVLGLGQLAAVAVFQFLDSGDSFGQGIVDPDGFQNGLGGGLGGFGVVDNVHHD